jgi:hypothetical protein
MWMEVEPRCSRNAGLKAIEPVGDAQTGRWIPFSMSMHAVSGESRVETWAGPIVSGTFG